MSVEIKKIRTIIDNDDNLSVDNIQKLPVTPQLRAKELQIEFDKNVDNLIQAIDGTGGFTESIYAYVQDVASSIVDPGGGDTLMTKALYDTGVSPSSNQNAVDRARYADTFRVSVTNGMLYLGIAPQE